MVTTAEPDFDGSAVEVASIVTSGGVGTPAGAVYKPSVVSVPHESPLHPAPDNCQPTLVMVVPPTDAKNRCCCPTRTVAWAGDTDTVTSEAAPRMTEELADALRSASEVAVTVITFDAGAVAGARYKPVSEIWPHTIPVQLVPERPQITTLLEVPLTTAVNCSWPPSGK